MVRLLILFFFMLAAKAAALHQHTTFLRAEKALKGGELQALDDANIALRDYPLWPYLQSLQLSYLVGRSNEKLVQAFLDRHDNSPFASDLRADWLRYLANRDDGAGFLLFYRPQKDVALRCHYIDFLTRNEFALPLREDFRQIWLTGDELPESCSPVEKRWIKLGERSESLLWQRLELAIEEKNHRLVRKLSLPLDKEQQKAIEQWSALHHAPEKILKPLPKSLTGKAKPYILADVMERLLWRDRDKAIEAWQRLEAEQLLPPTLRERVIYTYALGMATSGHPAAKDWLTRVSSAQSDERISGWRLVDAMRRWQWQEADYWLNQLPDSLRKEARYQYFRARTDQLISEGTPLTERTTQTFKALGERNDYYGFVSRAQLGLLGKPQASTLNIDAALLQQTRQLPAMQRIAEWLALDRQIMARREWYWATKNMSALQLQAAAIIANEFQWPERAVSALRTANAHAYWDLAYPLVHEDTMRTETEKRDVELSWAYAITRQESMFMSDAKSSAGALGLMQLMPATAKIVSKRFKQRYNSQLDLLQPGTNIKLGVAHLSELLDLNDGNIVYATAAYNAGQSRVNQWIARDGHLPLDLWIETIPFRETQHYVKNVVAYSLIYSSKLSGNSLAFEQVAASLSKTPVNSFTPSVLPAPR